MVFKESVDVGDMVLWQRYWLVLVHHGGWHPLAFVLVVLC